MNPTPLQVQFDPSSARFGASRSQKRLEDDRLLVGKGLFSDDRVLPRQAWLVLVRSPHAHARIGSIDLSEAQERTGVIAAWSMADLRADGVEAHPVSAAVQARRRLADGGAAAHAARRGQGVLRRPAGGGDRRRDARSRRRTRPTWSSSTTRICLAWSIRARRIEPGAPLLWEQAQRQHRRRGALRRCREGRRGLRGARRTCRASSCTTSA